MSHTFTVVLVKFGQVGYSALGKSFQHLPLTVLTQVSF